MTDFAPVLPGLISLTRSRFLEARPTNRSVAVPLHAREFGTYRPYDLRHCCGSGFTCDSETALHNRLP